MKTIYKYRLPFMERSTITMPQEAKIIRIDGLDGSSGMRTFVKISFSNHKYNLKGNAHNYVLDYDWKMVDRKDSRNCPQGDK